MSRKCFKKRTEVEYFHVDHYAVHGSREANARALLEDVQSFLRKVRKAGRERRLQSCAKECIV